METTLAQQAISQAIKCNWQEAKDINLQILEKDKNDIEALNRLAKCYSELGEISKAKEVSQKVLKIDSTNAIALKCFNKYKSQILNNKKNPKITTYSENFLEESGKTKIIDLLNLGDKKITQSLGTGEIVKMISHTHKVSIVTSDNKYIGRIPDDIAARLRLFIKAGNKYLVVIKSVSEDNVCIFVKEVLSKTKNPSFPPERIDYVSYTPPELVHKDIQVDQSES